MTPGAYCGYAEWKSWRMDQFGKVTASEYRYFAKELALAGVPSVADRHVLEIGFGNGAFGAWALGQGGIYVGVEAIPDLVRRARASGWSAFEASVTPSTLAPSGGFDLVVAFDVFEHLTIDAIERALGELRPAMATRGRLIGRVPSGDSPFARASQHGDRTHASTIGSSLVRQLAVRTGFRVCQVREPAWPIAGLGFRSVIRRAVVQAVRRVSFPLVARVFVGDRAAVMTPNLVFVLVPSA